MAIPPSSPSRRGFLGMAGGTAVAAMTGCAAKEAGSKGTAVAEDKLLQLVPAHIPYAGTVVPDLPGGPGVAPGYLKRPASVVQAVAEKPITSGQEIVATTPLWGPVPPGLGKNSYYAAVNERLGGTVRFNIADGTTYIEKINSVLASGDVPDMMQLPEWEFQKVAHFGDATNKLFADLSPYIAGDKAKDYPLLANYTQSAWSYGVFNGVLQGIPWENESYPFALFARKDLLDAKGLPMPASVTDLQTLGKALTDPKKKRWAFGNIDQDLQRAFGAPREWRKQPDGTLIYKYETPEWEESIAFFRDMFAKGWIHPAVVADRFADNKTPFGAGELAFMKDGLGAWHEMIERYGPTTPGFDMQAVAPFAAKPGGTPIVWRNEPASAFTFIKKGLSEDRIRECLRVANWCSAPFGTQEWDLVWDGVEGKHFTLAANGVPKKTALGTKEFAQTYLFLSGRPGATFHFQLKGFVETVHAWQTNAAKLLQEDPFTGIRVEKPSKMAGLTDPTEEKMNEIFRGKRPVSEWKAIVKDWQEKGGNEAREFYSGVARENKRL